MGGVKARDEASSRPLSLARAAGTVPRSLIRSLLTISTNLPLILPRTHTYLRPRSTQQPTPSKTFSYEIVRTERGLDGEALLVME